MDIPRNPRRPAGERPGNLDPGRRVDEMRDTVRDGAESLGSIVSGIIEDLQGVVRGEVQLAKTELKEDATQMGKGAGMAVAGALVGLVGFIFLMLGLTYALNLWMRMWIAAGIVGIVLLLIALALVLAGRNEIRRASLTPDQTIDSLKEDQEWASHQIKSVKK